MADRREDEQRDQFFADLGASAGYDAELAAWDVTLLDGLGDLPYDEKPPATDRRRPADTGC